MKLTLIRNQMLPDVTIGELKGLDNSIKIYTLEEPWRNNQKGISCIPAGNYMVTPHNWAGKTGFKFSRCWHVNNVAGRSAILIHSGNTTDDIEGCILVGFAQGTLKNKKAVLQSVKAINFMRERIGNKGFELQIIDGRGNI